MHKSNLITIKTMYDLLKYSNKIPTNILQDINNRIIDWIASGGKDTDPYIQQQFRYAENVLKQNI